MRIDWLSVVAGSCLIAAAVLLAAACGPSTPPVVPDVRYSGELKVCVADLALAKAAMKAADAGVDKTKLYDRYEACAEHVEATAGFDAGGK